MKNNLEDTKMARLHEILAVESSKKTLLAKLFDETKAKFGKSEFFQGFVRSLKMINDSPENAAIERSTADSRSLPTTVHETLAYVLQFFGEYEDIQIHKNATNQVAGETKETSSLSFNCLKISLAIPSSETLFALVNGLSNKSS